MRMLANRFGGEASKRHDDAVHSALRYMEEPTMLAERITQWCQEWLHQGRVEGRTEGLRSLLCRQAARRFGVAAGNTLSGLVGSVVDAERLAEVGELIVVSASADELFGVMLLAAEVASVHARVLVVLVFGAIALVVLVEHVVVVHQRVRGLSANSPECMDRLGIALAHCELLEQSRKLLEGSDQALRR